MSAGRHASRAEVEEVLLQAHLFVGFPIVLNAFGVWREMTAEGAGSSRGDAAAPPGGDGAHDSAAAGEALCRAVYGRSYERLRRNLGGCTRPWIAGSWRMDTAGRSPVRGSRWRLGNYVSWRCWPRGGTRRNSGLTCAEP